ncbi:MAG: S1 family peptidase [Methyloceanibacter sp.]
MWVEHPTGETLRQGLGAGALAAIIVAIVAIVSFAAEASPLMTGRSPSESISSQISLFHRVLIYAKEGSRKLVDGRWNLGQSESKLGIKLSPEETKQLMACTGKIVCQQPWGEVFATAVSVLRPDLLVTAKHVFSKVRGGPVSFGRCSFRSHLHRKAAIPVVVEKDQRRGYFLNNEDFIVVRLKRELEGCSPLAINDSDSSLPEGEQILSVTGYQLRTLNKISGREPVLAKGKIRKGFSGRVLGGPPFYYTDIDFDVGGSGGAVFALVDGRPVSDDEGHLILRGISVAYGPHAKNNRPYSDEQNYTIIIGLEAEFRDLVKGKAHKPAAVQPATCLQGGAAKIDVISESVPPTQSETLAPLLQQNACRGEATPDRKAGKANANCMAKELKGLAKAIGASQRVKAKHEFRLKNDTSCPICFTYNRCNDYGCWDEVVMASAKSTLFAGVGERAPVIKNPQFCMFGRAIADVGPSRPLRNPTRAVEPDSMFLAAKEKAKREGVHTLTSEDIRGLSLKQIRELRGY